MELSTLVKKRAGARTWLTKLVKRLQEEIADDDSDPVDIQDTVDRVKKQISVVEEVQHEVEAVLSEDRLESDVIAAEEISYAAIREVRRANRHLRKARDAHMAAEHTFLTATVTREAEVVKELENDGNRTVKLTPFLHLVWEAAANFLSWNYPASREV